MPMIDVKHLSKTLGTTTIVNDLSFSVAQREVFGLLGPNGAGKTTTVRMLTGLLRPTSGTVTIAGYDIVQQRRQAVQTIGVVFELPALYPQLTVEENLHFAAAIRGGERAHVLHIIEQFGLQAYRRHEVRTLSKGWRQRTMLARALLASPRVLFLDEPTSGLDPHAAATLHQTLGAVRDAGVTILMTTHDMVEAATLCHRVGILNRGVLVALDVPSALVDRLPNRMVRVTWWESGQLRRASVSLSDPNTPAFLHNVLAHHRVLEMETTGTLDEVYRQLTTGQEM